MKEFIRFVERIMRDNYSTYVRQAARARTPAAFFCTHYDEKVLRGGDGRYRHLG